MTRKDDKNSDPDSDPDREIRSDFDAPWCQALIQSPEYTELPLPDIRSSPMFGETSIFGRLFHVALRSDTAVRGWRAFISKGPVQSPPALAATADPVKTDPSAAADLASADLAPADPAPADPALPIAPPAQTPSPSPSPSPYSHPYISPSRLFLVSLGPDVDGQHAILHGGLTSALIDQVAGLCAVATVGPKIVTLEMTVRYVRRVIVPAVVACRAGVTKIEGGEGGEGDGEGGEGRGKGKRLWVRSTVHDGRGRLCAEGDSLFVGVGVGVKVRERGEKERMGKFEKL